MKAICPISGVPFRTYDSLALQWPVEHPIFSIPYEQLVLLLDDIKNQEEELLTNWNADSVAQKKDASEAAKHSDLTNATNIAIHEKQWRNPAFKLYQTKHLVMLAFMKHAELLSLEKGYACRPKPEVIDSHFWQGIELFSWVCHIDNPKLRNSIPRYRVSSQNEDFGNLSEYLEEVSKVQTNFGNRYLDISTEKKLAVWEQAIAILTRRREVLKEKLSTSNNPLAARWALTITAAPKDIWDFWYAILSSSSTKITFEGVKVNGKVEAVTAGDLRELYDYLDDNLIRPKGEIGEYHRDDSEFYFIARQTVLDIVRTHILTLEQGLSSYRIVNSAVGDRILYASDDALNKQALEAGLEIMPNFTEFPKRLDYIRALAGWRTRVRNKLLEVSEQESGQTTLNKEEKGKYEIL